MKRLPRQVRLFGVVSLLNDCASEMIYPLLPAFVTSVLGAGPMALGALDGAADAAAAFGAVFQVAGPERAFTLSAVLAALLAVVSATHYLRRNTQA